jgi:uncharacterized protein YndB with AHSA1/START domain
MSSTRISRHINAPRAAVYSALLDARAVAKWKVPDGMSCHVHAFDARERGSFHILPDKAFNPVRSCKHSRHPNQGNHKK